MAYTKPPKRKKEERERLRGGESDHIYWIWRRNQWIQARDIWQNYTHNFAISYNTWIKRTDGCRNETIRATTKVKDSVKSIKHRK